MKRRINQTVYFAFTLPILTECMRRTALRYLGHRHAKFCLRRATFEPLSGANSTGHSGCHWVGRTLLLSATPGTLPQTIPSPPFPAPPLSTGSPWTTATGPKVSTFCPVDGNPNRVRPLSVAFGQNEAKSLDRKEVVVSGGLTF